MEGLNIFKDPHSGGVRILAAFVYCWHLMRFNDIIKTGFLDSATVTNFSNQTGILI